MISFVVAYSSNRVIGKDGDLPWYLPEDLKRFKEITSGHSVIMGRKTFQSIFDRLGKALPNRRNIVISHSFQPTHTGIEVASSLEEALDKVKSEKEAFIIGGEAIYTEALQKRVVDRIYATEIDQKVDGDKFFPHLDMKNWRETSREQKTSNNLSFSFVTLEKTK
ncbi:dihydrofolate reductase [Candidatus Saccharibacteria bacterium]|nr:dihydrofolate reductase [Candidatus Saccharibacteria bacterium]